MLALKKIINVFPIDNKNKLNEFFKYNRKSH